MKKDEKEKRRIIVQRELTADRLLDIFKYGWALECLADERWIMVRLNPVTDHAQIEFPGNIVFEAKEA